MNLGQNLRIQRKIRNLTTYDIEKAINTTHQAISKWENNKSEPSIIQCIKLADYYNISLDELVGRDFF